MSTGDQTAYLRSKLATRRKKLDYGGPGGQWSSSPEFSKDGFQKWAESSAPARGGGVEKVPSMAMTRRERTGGGNPDDWKKIKEAVQQIPEDGPFSNDTIRGIRHNLLEAVDFGEKIGPYVSFAKELLKDKDVQDLAMTVNVSAPSWMRGIAKYMDLIGMGHLKRDKSTILKVGGSKQFKQWCKEEAMEHEGRHSDSESDEEHGGKLVTKEVGRHRGAFGEDWGPRYATVEEPEEAFHGGRIGMAKKATRVKQTMEERELFPGHKVQLPKFEVEEYDLPEGSGVPPAWLDRMEALARKEGGSRKKMGKREAMAGVKHMLMAGGLKKKDVSECMKEARGLKVGGDLAGTIKTWVDWAKKKIEALKATYVGLQKKAPTIHSLLHAYKLNEGLPKELGGPSDVAKSKIAPVVDKLLGYEPPKKAGGRIGMGIKEDIDASLAKTKADADRWAIAQGLIAKPKKGKGRTDSVYLQGGVGRDDAQQHFGAVYPSNGYKPQARLNNLAPDAQGSWGREEEDLSKVGGVGLVKKAKMAKAAYGLVKAVGGRKPSAYASFVKEFAAKHPGPDLMKRAAAAWKSR